MGLKLITKVLLLIERVANELKKRIKVIERIRFNPNLAYEL
jgi:hypothetical protein